MEVEHRGTSRFIGEPSAAKESHTFHTYRQDHNPSQLPLVKRLPLLASAGISSLKNNVPTATQPTADSPSYATSIKQGITSSEVFSAVCTKHPSTNARIIPKLVTETTTTSTAISESFQSNRTHPLNSPQTPSSRLALQDRRPRRAPASHSSNGIETYTGPPPALSTQRSFVADPAVSPNTSTTEWALAQQKFAIESLKLPDPTPSTPNTSNDKEARSLRGASKSLDETKLSALRPKIPPIRSFRASSTRASLGLEMSSQNGFSGRLGSESEDMDSDRDRTLRALEGFSEQDRLHDKQHHDQGYPQESRGQTDNSIGDLFLDMARDDMNRETSDEGALSTQTEHRRSQSRTALPSARQSLTSGRSTVQHTYIQPIARRGIDLQASSEDTSSDWQPTLCSYRTSVHDRQGPSSAHPLGSWESSRVVPALKSPTTPRGTGFSRESSDSPINSRRRSLSERSTTGFHQRSHSYRQSHLSQAMSRNYNSSPLVPRTVEVDDRSEMPRLEEGTNSTTSTTAPSTVWDELDNLKSRIHRLELTGKLPQTSGAAVSNATDNRPPTATTTNTTLSTSPKRGRNFSTSPVDSNATGLPTNDTHPMLHAALAKTKAILPEEVYSALYSTATDALSLASMMGSVTGGGPISSAQSVVGSTVGPVSDRQLRRKADSMCRSLTEVCLALSEMSPVLSKQSTVARPVSRDHELSSMDPQSPQQLRNPNASGGALGAIKPSPGALSRLQVRRSSLAAAPSNLSSLPSPRYTPSIAAEASTPTNGSSSGRRTSLYLRSRRTGTAEQEDGDTVRLKAPSRALTEIGGIRRSQTISALPTEYRERPSQRPQPQSTVDGETVMQSIEGLSEDSRDGAQSVLSQLPIRRRYASSNFNSPVTKPTPPGLQPPRRYLDRPTPDRDTTSLVGRMEEVRGQRHGSVDYQTRTIPRVGSLSTRRIATASDGAVAAKYGYQ